MLEVVIEPTGPAWLPIAVFFSARGHLVHRVSSAKAADLRRFLSRHTKTNGIDADTLARLPLFDPAGLQPLGLPGAEQAALDRRVRATDRLTQAGAEHKRRIKDLVRQLLPMTPLTGDLGVARPRRPGTLRRPERPAPAGIQASHRVDRQGLPQPPRRRAGRAVAGCCTVLGRALRRPPRGRVHRPGRRGRHRGPAAACRPGRARRPRRRTRGRLPVGRPARAGPQPARRRRDRRPRPRRRRSATRPASPPARRSGPTPGWCPRPPRPATPTARASPCPRPVPRCCAPP